MHRYPTFRHHGILLAAGLLLALVPAFLPAPAGATIALDPAWEPLMTRLIGDGYSPDTLFSLFTRPEVRYDPDAMGKKIRHLYRRKYKPKEDEPAKTSQEPRERVTVYDVHLTPEKLADIIVFRVENKAFFDAVEEQYGVPPDLVLSILVIESKLGEFLGNNTSFNNLASMANSQAYADVADYLDQYEPSEEQKKWVEEKIKTKADWAYKELVALIQYAEANKLDPTTLKGSIYGAIGLCQFMPSNAIRLGRDGDGNGVVDLFSPPDAIMSVGSFLSDAGWDNDLSKKKKIKVIKRYNPDDYYAKMVLLIAGKIGRSALADY